MNLSLATVCNDIARYPREQWDDRIRYFIGLIGIGGFYPLLGCSAALWLGDQMKRLDRSHIPIVEAACRPSKEEIAQSTEIFEFLDEVDRHAKRINNETW